MNGSLLADGTVVFAGGQDGPDPGDFVNAVPLVKDFVPSADAWRQLDDLQHTPGRWYPGMSRLADGSFLVMGGGQCCDAARTDTAERFDLETRTWSYIGKLSGSQLALNWGASCSSVGTDYEIYEGELGDFATHAPLTCSTGGVTQATIVASEGDRYYVVVPRNSSREGSYGTTSSGSERPQGIPACLTRVLAGCP